MYRRSLTFATRSVISATFSLLKYGIPAAIILCWTAVRRSYLARISDCFRYLSSSRSTSAFRSAFVMYRDVGYANTEPV
ncbi:hypothetical protein DPMN_121683 [Dreissena polymorpha]|uniref:Uncharacterized protein n=1 Tax=Dreissena polymorpha TaxID=45954 RepID=A0A9D4GMJ7_DREPO|nr:hypothetical protein DPMN_121683 [Dreissena polymorpha]